MAAKLSSSILMVSVIAILIPAGFDAALTVSTTYNEEARLIKEMSRIIAIMLIITYGAYLVFQCALLLSDLSIDNPGLKILTRDIFFGF